jgi:hypothetical protein
MHGDEADMRVIVGSTLPAGLALVCLLRHFARLVAWIRLYCALNSLSAILQVDVGVDLAMTAEAKAGSQITTVSHPGRFSRFSILEQNVAFNVRFFIPKLLMAGRLNVSDRPATDLAHLPVHG